MKKVVFGITSLTLGGADRVLVDLVNDLIEDYDITIYTLYSEGILEKQLDRRIKVKSLYEKSYDKYSKLQKLRISFKLFFSIKPPEGYDVYVSFLEGPITRLFSKIIDKKKIAWVHNDISKVFGKGIKAKIKGTLDKKVYQKYDKIIFVSNENKKQFYNKYNIDVEGKVIRNYLNFERVLDKSKENIFIPYNTKDINLVSVCRLVDQKALDRFIKVHSKLENDGIHSKVYIIGEGTLEKSLQNEIDRLEESDCFYLLGAKENPYPFIKEADYFCLFSYYEGYPMVLEEAKVLGKNILITKNSSVEVVENYKNSKVFDNSEDGIYKGLKDIISSSDINVIEKNNIDEKTLIEESKKYYGKILEDVKSIIKK